MSEGLSESSQWFMCESEGKIERAWERERECERELRKQPGDLTDAVTTETVC